MASRITLFLPGFFRIIRIPNLLIIGATQYLTAFYLVANDGEGLEIIKSLDLFFISLSTLLIAAAGYIINDYYDVKIDYINKPDKVVVGSKVKRRVAMFIHTYLNFAGIALAFYVSIKLGVIHLLAAILLWGYSNQLKRLPLVGNISVSILTALSLLVVALLFKQNENLVFIYALFAFAISLIREVVKDMEDIKGDELYGCKTLPIVWGYRKTKVFIYLISVVFIYLMQLLIYDLGNSALSLYFIVLVAPILVFLFKLYRADTKGDYRQLSNLCKLIMISGVLSMIFL